MLKPFLFFYPIIFHVLPQLLIPFPPILSLLLALHVQLLSTSFSPSHSFLHRFLFFHFCYPLTIFLIFSSTASPFHSLSTLFFLLLYQFSFFSSFSSSHTSFTLLFTFPYFFLLFPSSFFVCLFSLFFLSNDYLSDFQIYSKLISYVPSFSSFSFIFFSLFGYLNLG